MFAFVLNYWSTKPRNSPEGNRIYPSVKYKAHRVGICTDMKDISSKACVSAGMNYGVIFFILYTVSIVMFRCEPPE